MKDKIEAILDENIKPERTPVLKSSPNSIVANVTGVVDGKKQLLRDIKPVGANAYTPLIPVDLDYPGGIVYSLLLKTFMKQGFVKEGLIGDVIFGFEACGIPPDLTIQGLANLNKNGYVKFQAKDNTYVSIYDDASGGAWVKYLPKLLNNIY